MDLGPGKYHPGGDTCGYKRKTVPCLVKFYEGWGISGHILTNVLRHLDDFKLYDNDKENSIIPALLVDGHVSHFDMFFLINM